MSEYGQALTSGIWPSMDILPETERQLAGQPLNLPPIQIRPIRPLGYPNKSATGEAHCD